MKGVTKDVEEFVQNCLHCIISRIVERVPRPLTMALHEQKLNGVEHLDFLYIGTAKQRNMK